MFKFGRKDKDKSKLEDKKKERKESKKEKKLKDSSLVADEADGERYTPLKYPPPVTPKPSVKNGKPLLSRGILKTRGSSKSKGDHRPVVPANLDDERVLRENTRINEELSWRVPPDSQKLQSADRRKRESIHSITMNIAPPSVPPPASAAEKVYSVDLELPTLMLPPSIRNRELTIARQPKGDFGFNLRWAPYKDAKSGTVRQVVHAEPGSSGSKSGVVTGDRIIEVNGRNVEHDTREAVIALVQKSGDAVKLKVQQVAEVSELNQRPYQDTDKGETNEVNGHRAEVYWLVHKGGYSSCHLTQPASPDGSRCKVQLDKGAHVLEVDENDLEKVNPTSLDRCENLSSLRYLNESSLLHVLRQRYGSSLIHTVTGPSLLVVNPEAALNIYSHKIMQMVKGCRLCELPPHVYSQAQSVYEAMLSTSRDQSIVLSGRAGSGKTTSLRHILSYYAHCYGGVHSTSLDEKLAAACVVLESLGNCSSKHNTNATRFSQLVTLDFDNHGHLVSTAFQVTMLDKSQIVKSAKGESALHIFSYVKNGVSASVANELQLQGYSLADEHVDKEAASAAWAKLDQSLRVLAITADESKIIQQVVAAIVHIQNSGVSYGANSKAYFAKPTGAQTACQLLGVSMEELSKAIFSPSSNKSNARVAEDNLSAGKDALEGFVVGLYMELFNMIVSLVNRSLSLGTRCQTSITVVDVPGFNDDVTQPLTFADLCYNYVCERMQLLFHEKTFTENRERYIQENIDIEYDDTIKSAEAMVNLLDKCTAQQQLQLTASGSTADLSSLGREEEGSMGLLWILDQVAMTPAANERQFVDRLHQAHGRSADQLEKLVVLHGHDPSVITLNHCHGTSPVAYNTSGWIKDCRNHPSAERAISLLNSSQRSGLSDMFNSMTGSMVGSFTSTSSRGVDTLRGVSSARRLIANQTGIKRRSQAILVKYQADSIIESVAKTRVHFISHVVGRRGGTHKSSFNAVLDVPYVRVQIRSLQLLPAIRYYCQGYPEHMTFGDFISRYSVLAGKTSTDSVALVDQRSVVESILGAIEVNSSYYRIGLSQVFLRPAASAHLDHQRELRRTFYAVAIQKHMRRYLAQKAMSKLKLKHEAMKCIQKNIRIHFKLSGWQWWKLYTKIKPLVNVHQTEDDLRIKESELRELKARLESLESEKATYKKECARFEDEVVRFQAELAQERFVSRQAVEVLEQETSSRLALETQLTDIETDNEYSKLRIAELEHENDNLRQVHQDYDDTHSELTDASSVSLSKYEHMVKEQEMKMLEWRSEHDSELENIQLSKHKLERQMHELSMERQEQQEQVHNLKKKVQKYSNEAQDLKRRCEESEAHNVELEKKLRRFDNELHHHAGDVAGERNMKEILQRERDQLLKQKYTLGQQLEDITVERDALQSKLRRLEHEMSELRCAGTGESELMQLRTIKHELERKLAESEDDIGDMQQEMHELEMAKLKLQMEVDKVKQKQQKELDQLEREMDELREASTRKTRNYESRVAELDEELQAALQGKREAERKLIESRDAEPVRDHEREKELKVVIRRLRCLLTDSQSQLLKSKEQTNQKSQIRMMETKLEDLQANLTASLKSKHALEVDLQECQAQLSTANKAKLEAEDRVAKLMRDKTDVENEKEDLDEEMHELLKRYQSLLAQNSVTAMTVRGQSEQLTALADSKNKLQEELDAVQHRVSHLESHYVPKELVAMLESRCLEVEQKLDYEKSLHIRFENSSLKAKDQCERLEDEVNRLNGRLLEEDRRCRQIQSQLSRALESQEDVHRKDIEQTQTISNLTQRLEVCETEMRHLQTELKSAHKRAENLQSTLLQSTLSDDEDEEFDTDSEDGYS